MDAGEKRPQAGVWTRLLVMVKVKREQGGKYGWNSRIASQELPSKDTWSSCIFFVDDIYRVRSVKECF